MDTEWLTLEEKQVAQGIAGQCVRLMAGKDGIGLSIAMTILGMMFVGIVEAAGLDLDDAISEFADNVRRQRVTH